MPELTNFDELAAPLPWHKINCPCCGLSLLDTRLHAALSQLYDLTLGLFALTSVTRCRPHNKTVGGVIDSLHLHGRAADLTPLDHELLKLATLALSVPAFAHGGFGLYPDRGIIHVDIRPRPSRWAKVGSTFTEFARTWTAVFPRQEIPGPPTIPAPYSSEQPATWR